MTFKDNITARYALDLKLLRRQIKELYSSKIIMQFKSKHLIFPGGRSLIVNNLDR